MIVRGSLSFRLLAGAVLWIAAALLVAGLALSQIFRAHSEEQVAQRLEAELNALAASLRVGPDGAVMLAQEPAQPQFRVPYSGSYWQIADAEGAALLRARSLWDKTLRLPADELLDGSVHRHQLSGPDGAPVIVYERAVNLPERTGRFRLVVAENAAFLEASLARFDRTLVISLGVLGIGLILAAIAQVTLGLRPLARLGRQLAAVRAGKGERLSEDFPREIEPLVAELNAVLEQNAEVVARARTQAGNLAHSLKTPLAVLANEAGALAAHGEAELAGRLSQQTGLMQRQIDYHLARARAAAATRVPGMRTMLAPQAQALARTLAQVFHERGLAIELAVPDDLAFRGERQDLDEMLGNVMENACKWAARRVRVGGRREGQWLVVTVEDDGPGLPAERRAEVFDRGRRLDESTAGTGLGLSIVRDLAELYDGDVSLQDSDLGGLRVTLRLPAPADP